MFKLDKRGKDGGLLRRERLLRKEYLCLWWGKSEAKYVPRSDNYFEVTCPQALGWREEKNELTILTI